MIEKTFSSREEWLNWRQGGIGATDAAALAAAAGLVTPAPWMEQEAEQVLFWDKLGMGKPVAVNAAMQRGIELEESIRTIVETDLGFIAPVCGERPDRPWMRASFDGITLDGEIVEIKVPNRQVVDLARSGEVVGYYQPQLAHQAMVAWGDPASWSGKERIHFCVWDDQTQEVVRVTLESERLRALAKAMLPILEAFWDRVQRQEAPVGGAAWYDLALELANAKSNAALGEAAKERVREAVANGYKPQYFAVRHQKARAMKRVQWKEVIQHLGVSEDLLEPFRRPSSWVVTGGVKPLPDVSQWSPKKAEEQAVAALVEEKRLEDLAAQAKALAQSLGRTLVGPWGLRVYERAGQINYKAAAEALAWSQEIIDMYTKEIHVDSIVALVLKA